MDCCMAWSKNATNFLGTNYKSLPLVQFKTNTIMQFAMWLEHKNSGVTQPHVTKFHPARGCERIWVWDCWMGLHNKLTPFNIATWMLLSDDTKALCRDFSSLIPTLFSGRGNEPGNEARTWVLFFVCRYDGSHKSWLCNRWWTLLHILTGSQDRQGFLQWESHIHCFLWTPHFVEFFTTFSD